MEAGLSVNPDALVVGITHLRALGTTVTMAVDNVSSLPVAEAVLRHELDAIDRTCSRFRVDSELNHLATTGGHPVRVSALLYEAVSVACAVAERTGGAVDPTVGRAVEAIGYDRDFAEVAAFGQPLDRRAVPAPGWWLIDLDDRARSVAVPSGVSIDLGATAKALVADRAARHIASATNSGALVCVGGDVSVSGPAPLGGWPVGIAVDCTGPFEAGPVVAVEEGGLASSSTTVRSWRRGGRRLHHIIDPATGDCASDFWRLVTVAGANCVDANAFSTAAVVWGERALDRLDRLKVPARLVRHDGVVSVVGGWPPDEGSGTTDGTVPEVVRS